MKKILYIGNKLGSKGKTATSIDVLGPLFEKEGYEMYYSSSYRNKGLRLGHMLLSCFKYRKLADIVLIDTYSTQNFYYALLVSLFCKVLKLPYIPILRGGDLERRLKKNYKSCKRIFDHARLSVAPSQFLKEVFKAYGFENVICIPNSIDLKLYPFKKREKLHPKILWVRAFAEIYNPYMAVKTVEKLREKDINASLSMVGPDKDGSMERTKHLAQELGVNVEFTGKMEKSEWRSYAENFDLFINTTNFDNTPISVIEAMALGLPVITTNVGGIPYLVADGEDALLVEKNDVMGMTDAIIQLLDRKELVQKIIKNARAKVQFFDWDTVKMKWKDIFFDVS